MKIKKYLPPSINMTGAAIVGVLAGFRAKTEWRYVLQQAPLPGIMLPLQFILLPASLVINLLEITWSFYYLLSNKNKTFGMFAHLFTEIGITLFIGTSILIALGIISVAGVTGPLLFISGILLGTAYHATACLSRVIAWRKAKNNHESEAEQIHKQYAYKHFRNFMLSISIAVGFALLLFSGFGPVPILAIGIATAAVTVLGSAAISIWNFKSQQKVVNVFNGKHSNLLIKEALPKPILRASTTIKKITLDKTMPMAKNMHRHFNQRKQVVSNKLAIRLTRIMFSY